MLEHASKLEATGLRGTIQRLLRLRNNHHEVAAGMRLYKRKHCRHDKERSDYLEQWLHKAVENDGEDLYEFGDPGVEDSWWQREDVETRRSGEEILKAYSDEFEVQKLAEDERKFANAYIDWHEQRSKELADRYEASREKLTRR